MKIRLNFQPNTIKGNEFSEKFFGILKVKELRNNNFLGCQVVKENSVAYTITFLQYYISVLSTSVKNLKNITVLIKKNSGGSFRLYH